MTENVASTFCHTLVDEWLRLGVTDAVISPGSRSTPMALALADADGMRCHVHLDERSAAFMALGLGLATGRPAVVLTTSGTAAVELHPAVVEAHHAGTAMLVVTADRPPEAQGVWAPQTIDQRELYGTAVRWFCEPGPPEGEHRQGWRHLARDAFARTLGRTPGPVHLNLGFREPLTGGPGELPPALPPISSDQPEFGLLDEQVARLTELVSGRRGVITAGVRSDLEVLDLAAALGWPVLADAASGCRVDHAVSVTTFDAILRDEEVADRLRPEVVLRFGGLLASRVTNEWLAASGATQIGVDGIGIHPDPHHVLADRLYVHPAAFARGLLGAVTAAPADWPRCWADAERAARAAIDELLAEPLDEPTIADAVLGGLPDEATLMVSSSMPVRDLEWYARPRAGVRVLANRGANGIDGVTSTAVGAALDGDPTAVLLGDLAFLHDSGALHNLAGRGIDLLIVVVDNRGGGIFSFLPQAGELAPDRYEQLFGTPHAVDLVGLASAHGLAEQTVSSVGDLTAAIADWSKSGGTRVVVASSERTRNVDVHETLNAAAAVAARRAIA